MNTPLTVAPLGSGNAANAILGLRPIVNKRTGLVTIDTGRGLRINSFLRKDEWEDLDATIVQASLAPLRLTNSLVSRGLTRRLGGLGSMTAQYNRIGEMTAASATISGHASVEKDLVVYENAGVPVPVIAKEFEIDERLLAASRTRGDGLDTTNAAAAARVVAEKIEDLLILGDTSINFDGNTIYGLTTHPNRNTGTATGIGGGDWGTAGNAEKTVAGMIGNAQADGFYGPYGLYAATTQYNEAALGYHTDGSGDTPRDRIMRLPGIAEFVQIPQLADGVVLLVQLTSDVVQIAYVPGYFPSTTREWVSGDRMLNSFKVLAVTTPVVKASSGSKSGVVHITGA
jgi:uncharacterized linocin/CFP29 family protein